MILLFCISQIQSDSENLLKLPRQIRSLGNVAKLWVFR